MFREEAPKLFDEHAGEAEERFERYLANIASRLRGIALIGIELDVIHDGRFVIPDGRLADFYPVVGAVHFLLSASRKRPFREIEEEFRRQVSWFAERGGIDVLAHPFRVLAQDEIPVSDALVEWVVKRASEGGLALEINSHKQLFELDVRLAAEAMKAGALTAVGTDAHEPREFGEFSYHEMVFEAATERAQGAEVRLYIPEREEGSWKGRWTQRGEES
ncbi:MAG: hypothetical protein V2A58_08730 [Planctomycetota bacterium]